ncbi:quinone-dependent dihydroorotate dehydrogenase [Lentzea californiensis]|uniref:quinone-dependent dihydroorotate dehydrogenase n=1 Tax=Lentzea californiensis TaxID=438851 RepID=UPI002164B81E|nr:quinone-dependent dihydroorotate dehydrogenase [Lentzea californiensis]MCR3748477.1 dihydroorotate oxidase A [Lentzea californiensis]
MVYKQVVRRALFGMHGGDAERVHETTLDVMARLSPLARFARNQNNPRTVFGVRFPNPVGLAAGLDKDGRALPAWGALGFGFVEVGTVTWHAQPGNPKPRLFRLREDEAIINRMGFNNAGAQALAAKLGRTPLKAPLGISLGKSKITPVEDAVQDYLNSLNALKSHGDYFAINVSSPNTPGLRSLQDKGALTELVATLTAATDKPMLVKIAPDLTEDAISEVIQVCVDNGIKGLIATNTTLSREGLMSAHRSETGGLSGKPLTQRANEVVRFITKNSDLPVIGVGGIASADDAKRMVDAGASLVQIYTGFIYEGPGLVSRINRALR